MRAAFRRAALFASTEAVRSNWKAPDMTLDSSTVEAPAIRNPPAARWLQAGALSLLFAAGAVSAQEAAAEPFAHFRTVHSFAFGGDRHAGGARPRTPMLASDGNLYGLTFAGGSRQLGSMYRVAPGGHTTTVYEFHARSDGFWPEGALIQASDGRLYGVASFGGDGAGSSGTVFSFDMDGTLTTLHTFHGDDGADPSAGLVQASDGNLYGTTSSGGQNDDGTIYRIGLDGSFAVLHHFDSAQDGGRPLASLIQIHDGRLCGTTYWGAHWNGGTVYCMTLAGEFSVVHAFGARPGDAGGSANPLLEGDDGTLFGTSNFGGSQDQGALFQLSLDGRIHVRDLWARPSGGLMKASDGYYYGTVFYGGTSDQGWIYRISPTRKLVEVHSFSGPDGQNPDGELVEGTDGGLYGVTESGGDTDAGVLFRIAH
jgi:uncharacterized repeat protein (TIGR03803 family)